MEQDRFQQNHTLYIIGIIGLLLSISLIMFSLYIIPYIFFDWIYNVPYLILDYRQWLVRSYEFSLIISSWIVFLTFFLSAIVAGAIAYYCSNAIDNDIYGMGQKSSRLRMKYPKEIGKNILMILIIVFGVYLLINLMEWFFSVSPGTGTG